MCVCVSPYKRITYHTGGGGRAPLFPRPHTHTAGENLLCGSERERNVILVMEREREIAIERDSLGVTLHIRPISRMHAEKAACVCSSRGNVTRREAQKAYG